MKKKHRAKFIRLLVRAGIKILEIGSHLLIELAKE